MGIRGRVGIRGRESYAVLLPDPRWETEPLQRASIICAAVAPISAGEGATAMPAGTVCPGTIVVLSVGVVDSGEFRGEPSVDSLRARTEEMLRKYVSLANGLGCPAAYRFAIGTDTVAEAEKLCLEAAQDFPRIVFFAGKVVFQRERWYQPLLHNEVALALQKGLHWAGRTMVVLSARVK